jgi:uncharacterized lipoprotein
VESATVSKVPKWRDPKLVLGGVGRERDERTGETTWLIVRRGRVWLYTFGEV